MYTCFRKAKALSTNNTLNSGALISVQGSLFPEQHVELKSWYFSESEYDYLFINFIAFGKKINKHEHKTRLFGFC